MTYGSDHPYCPSSFCTFYYFICFSTVPGMSPNAPNMPCGGTNQSWDSSCHPACKSGSLLLWTVSKLFHFMYILYLADQPCDSWQFHCNVCVFNSYFIFNPPVLTAQRRSFPIVQTSQSLLDLNASLPLDNFVTFHHISYLCPSSHFAFFTPIPSFLLIPLCLVAMVVAFPPVLP